MSFQFPVPDVLGGITVLRDQPYFVNWHPRQKLDLYVPQHADHPLPLIIWIHGGAWLEGSKDEYAPLEYLAEGYAVASLNYRLSQHAIFPAQLEDCKAAVRWLRANARKYNLDPQRFAAWGASAGGHLVALLGVTGEVSDFEVGKNLSVSSQVQAVVDYFGPTDFLQMDAQRAPDGVLHDAAHSPESRLVGGWIRQFPERVAKASPLTYVTSRAAPFLIVHGDHDPIVAYPQSQLLENALKKAGVPVTFYTVQGGGHGGFTDPQVAEVTKEFLEKYLK